MKTILWVVLDLSFTLHTFRYVGFFCGPWFTINNTDFEIHLHTYNPTIVKIVASRNFDLLGLATTISSFPISSETAVRRSIIL